MNFDTKDSVIGVLIFALFICAIGWYSAATTQNSIKSNTSGSDQDSEHTLELAEERLIEYSDALSKANNRIEESNTCVDDAFQLIDEGYFDDGLSQIDDCRYETVSDPGTSL